MRGKEIYGLNLLQIICIDLFCFHSAEANGNHLSPDLSQLIWKKKNLYHLLDQLKVVQVY